MSKVLRILLIIYQKLISDILLYLFGKGCRYTPTCSEYAKEAILELGATKGTWKAIKRLSRCHPWSEGGYDPI